MTKHFCDMCGVELTDENVQSGAPTDDTAHPKRLGGKYSRQGGVTLMFHVTTGLNNAWNDGEFCRNCVLDAVRSLDNRPRVSR